MGKLAASLCLLTSVSASFSLADRSSVNTCARLQNALPGKVIGSNTTAYDAVQHSYFYGTDELSPSCVVQPGSAADVSTFIKTIGQSSTKFAIRGGGMSPNAGWANIDRPGVTLDLRNVSKQSLNHDRTIISSGGGANWGQVYDVLDPLNLGVVGSRVNSSGVGGSVTSGGLAFTGPSTGWQCDHVRNLEVVLACGDIVNANATSNSDLFRALKGGSNNFGVVTRVDMETFSHTAFWGGAIEYPYTTAPQQLEALVEFHSPRTFDPDGESELSFLYSSASNGYFAANILNYRKPIVNASGLAPFTKIQPQLVNTMRIAKANDLAKEVYAFNTIGAPGVLATFTIKSSLYVLNELQSIWENSSKSDTLRKVAQLNYGLGFQAIPPTKPGADNSLGLPANTTEFINILLTNTWQKPTDTAYMLNTTEVVFKQLTAAAQKAGAFQGFEYLNYAAAFQKPLQTYGSKNLEFLKQVSKKYDPTGMFQTQVPGGFKLHDE